MEETAHLLPLPLMAVAVDTEGTIPKTEAAAAVEAMVALAAQEAPDQS